MVVQPSAGRSIPCQLHCWAQREKKRQKLERAGKKIDGDALKMDPPPGSRGKDVIRCKMCNVNLCVRCWEIFHSEVCLDTKINTILSFK